MSDLAKLKVQIEIEVKAKSLIEIMDSLHIDIVEAMKIMKVNPNEYELYKIIVDEHYKYYRSLKKIVTTLNNKEYAEDTHWAEVYYDVIDTINEEISMFGMKINKIQ